MSSCVAIKFDTSTWVVILCQISCEQMGSLGANRTSKENTETVLVRGNGDGKIHMLTPLAVVRDPRVLVVDAEYLAH